MDVVAPILVIGYKRPDLLKDLLLNITAHAPNHVLIFIDGPKSDRNSNDLEAVLACREVVNSVSLDCRVDYHFSEKNLGCGRGVSSAISWAFQFTDKLIILEDDIVFDKNFLNFCTTALVTFEKDVEILGISGFNPIHSLEDCDYVISKFPQIWGWATWRDRWDMYDLTPPVPSLKLLWLLFTKFNYKFFITFTKYFDFIKLYSNCLDTWDYQLLYLSLKNNFRFILPVKSLIKNVGFDHRATHTKNYYQQISHLEYGNPEQLNDFIFLKGCENDDLILRSLSSNHKFILKDLLSRYFRA
jgi:hypothetical protein